MSTLVVPMPALLTVLTALNRYHKPRPDTVFDMEALRPHARVVMAMANPKRLPLNFCTIEADPSQIEGLLTHMRVRGLTRGTDVMNAATAIRTSLSVLDEVRA